MLADNNYSINNTYQPPQYNYNPLQPQNSSTGFPNYHNNPQPGYPPYQQQQQQPYGIPQQLASLQQQKVVHRNIIRWSCIAMINESIISMLLYIFIIGFEFFFPNFLFAAAFQFMICLIFLFKVTQEKVSMKLVKYFKISIGLIFFAYFIVLFNYLIRLAILFILPAEKEDWIFYLKPIVLLVGMAIIKLVINYMIKKRAQKNAYYPQYSV